MTKRARSPVLGYNHNLRYRGRTFHVQTEDSGQAYARLHTHLFYEGTILSSKKEEYDPDAPEEDVRALMQKLHKTMIKELTHQAHDERIGAFFVARGEPAMLEERPAPAGQPAAPPPPVAPSLPAPVAAPPVAVVSAGASAVRTPAASKPKPAIIANPTALKRSPVQVSNPADGVVVRRNVVINVGAGQPPVKGTVNPTATPAPVPARPRAGAHYAVRGSGGGFVAGTRARATEAVQPVTSTREIRMPWATPGPSRISQPVAPAVAPQPPVDAAPTSTGKLRMPWDPPAPSGAEARSAGLVSDKSLDEVILEYLADDGETEER